MVKMVTTDEQQKAWLRDLVLKASTCNFFAEPFRFLQIAAMLVEYGFRLHLVLFA